MKVSQRTVAILLTEEGQSALQLAVRNLPESRVVSFYVQDTNDMGMWVRVRRQDGDHLLLVRWGFILTIDAAVGETRAVGLIP